MSYKDTLELYDELISNGYSDKEARAHIKIMNKVRHKLTHDRADYILDKIDRGLFWNKVVGGIMVFSIFTMPYLFKWFK